MDVQAISFTGKTPKMLQNVKCSKEYQEAMSKLLGQSDKDFFAFSKQANNPKIPQSTKEFIEQAKKFFAGTFPQ